jgi:vitamin B12 transporter
MSRPSLLALLALSPLMPTGLAAAPPEAKPPALLDEVVVTATARPEARARLTSTVQVIDATEIAESSARSITDLLAAHAAGFFSEWTPGQTSINLRGGASDGQGKDFRSQVLVLMNGRRAGTANLSKLSPSDVERIEIVRGPASVVYGSQNIGGVVNLITRTGATSPVTTAQLTAGSRDLKQGALQAGFDRGTWDFYLGLSAGERDDYRAGSGNTMANTSWERWGATLAAGGDIADAQRLQLALRVDGVYDVGFRGSGGNLFSRDNRFNRSAELHYQGGFRRLDLQATLYAVQDVDDFRWASPVIRSAANLPVPGTAVDNNYRELEVQGLRLQPRFAPWAGNELLLGVDWERSILRSTRFRLGVPGTTLAQVPPQDNDQTDRFAALYFEDAQQLLDDRLTVRAGLRRTEGRTSFDPTPNLALQRARSADYQATTYSFGAAWRATDTLVLRAAASTGFRAPTATELAADFTALGGGRVFGNPDLDPETSRQLELGAAWQASRWRVDAAVFENVISDRIITVLRSGVANTSDYANNPADIEVRGVEWQVDGLLHDPAVAGGWRWSADVSGAYNFEMEDRGAPATANVRKVQRMYQYQGRLGTRLARGADKREWSLRFEGVLRGPMWYDTEESLLVPAAEPTRAFVHRKSPFWIWNLRGERAFAAGWSAFVAVNNLLDENEHPIFIAIDETPTKADLRFYNGAAGTSMPGREVVVGARVKF